MNYTALLRDGFGIVFTEVKIDLSKSDTIQKYFYPSPNFKNPHLILLENDEIIRFIDLKPTTFKSGKFGFSGIVDFGKFIIRANISEGESTNYKRLTIVTEQMYCSEENQFNNYDYNNIEANNHESHNN